MRSRNRVVGRSVVFEPKRLARICSHDFPLFDCAAEKVPARQVNLFERPLATSKVYKSGQVGEIANIANIFRDLPSGSHALHG